MVAILLGLGFQSCDRKGNNGGSTSVIWVDLGLPSGLLWADRNVGASCPEAYGNYYAWGETAPKEVYDWDTYAHNSGAFTKYCNNPGYGLNGFTDNLTTLEASDDAATANLGGGARTPTEDEWRELIDHTATTWITLNGVNGRLLIGANGKSIFLPAADVGVYGNYWSSSMLHLDYPVSAWYFHFESSGQGMHGCGRYNGYPVRAVRASQR